MNQILKRQTSCSHYGSKSPAVTIIVFKYRNKIGRIVFTLALKTTDKDVAAVVKNDSKTCIRKLILETLGDENMSMSQTSSNSCEGYDLQISPCSAVNVVQYVLQNVNAKRVASLMYNHFYLHVGTSP